MITKPAPYRVGHGGYVSEFDQFLDHYLATHPRVVQDRQRGWYIWWDRRVDLDELARQRQASVPLGSYAYA